MVPHVTAAMVSRVDHYVCHSLLQSVQHPGRFVQISAALLYVWLTMSVGVFIVNDTFEVTITQNAVFKPECTGGTSGIIHGATGDNSTVTDQRPPFYSSTAPQIFAIAAATVISYFLVILIFITPRTFFVGGPGGGAGFLTRRGLGGNSSVVGVGRRPLLQKIAAITVAVSMTIATADTFEIAKRQYEDGFMDSEAMVRHVVGGLEIRVAQVISDTFLWLAQVQTLIRLFPRRKEKVTIKWLGFALILLDVIFSSLNNFLVSGGTTRPLKSQDAIPAFSYLFELAIGFIYASCIIYYSISKYRFAFYHAKMRNICLVALLSMTSVLIPVVFFVIDVSSPDIAAWGFYIRWVGAAAASVVVWEWVERIEALERDERKDGILGREIYDGDEMLDATTANGLDWPGTRMRHESNGSDGNGNTAGMKEGLGAKHHFLRSRIPFNHRTQKQREATVAAVGNETLQTTAEQNLSAPAPPAAVATPISRADTMSAASTVYAIRYHNLHTSSPQIPENGLYEPTVPEKVPNGSISDHTFAEKGENEITDLGQAGAPTAPRTKPVSRPLWAAVSNPFKRKRSSPPAEITGAQTLDVSSSRRSPAALVNPENWNLRSKMDHLTTIQRGRLRARRQARKVDEPLPVTIIPAQARGSRTWSPDDRAEVTDAASHILIHSDVGPSRTPVQSSGNDNEGVHVTAGPAPVQGQRICSPEGPVEHQEPLTESPRAEFPVQEGEESTRLQEAQSDSHPSARAQQPVHPESSSKPVETRTLDNDRPSASSFSTLNAADVHEVRPSSVQAVSNSLYTQAATSLGPDMPDTSSLQQQQDTSLPSPHRSEGDKVPTDEDRQNTPTSSTQHASETPPPPQNSRNSKR
jgi:PalH/RIM21